MDSKESKNEIKKFLIKLVAITFALIIVINTTFNLIFAEKLENLNMLLSLNKKGNIELLKNKLREELRKGIEKEQIINDEDKLLLIKFFKKIKEELKNTEIQ